MLKKSLKPPKNKTHLRQTKKNVLSDMERTLISIKAQT